MCWLYLYKLSQVNKSLISIKSVILNTIFGDANTWKIVLFMLNVDWKEMLIINHKTNRYYYTYYQSLIAVAMKNKLIIKCLLFWTIFFKF